MAVRSQVPAPGDTSLVKEYLAESDVHYHADRIDSAAWYCLKAGDVARALNYQKGIADFISYYIPILNRQGKYQEGLTYALEALEICKSLGDNSLLAMAYNNVGNQNQYLGDLKSTATNYLNALIFSEVGDSPHRRLRYINNLASVFLALEDKSKSYYYAGKSYKLAVETQDSLGLASSLVNLALSEVLNERFDAALKHLDQVFQLGKALNDNSYVLDALINKADIYSQMGKYATALELYEQSHTILRNYPVPDYELYVHWGLAQNHFHLSRYGQAHTYLLKAIELGKEVEALQELSMLYLLGSEINEKMDRHAAALDFRKQFEVLNDSLVGIKTRQNIHQLEIEYQTAQKEKAIADQQLTITRNNLEIERKDKSILLWSTIAITLLSAIVIFVLVFRNRQQRNAEKIQLLQKQSELQVLNALVEGEEKERSRLARELHDGVGGILSASRMHLSILQEDAHNRTYAKDFRKISSMLDQAAQEIRTIAHNLFPEIVSMHSLGVAIGNYCERMKSSGLNIDYYCLGELPEFEDRFKLVVYRAVQELVNNVMKHSKADHVLVQLSHYNNILTIIVEDNGIGFKKDVVKGMGLATLQDKVKRFDGHVSVESGPGRGTTVQLEFGLGAERQHSVGEASTMHA